MRVLVLGAGGMAGHVIAIRLSELGYEVTGFARRELPFCKMIVGDVQNINLSELVHGYDAVINCIGCLVKSVEENPGSGIYINACLPHLLSKYANRVVHLSTDCVFSGKDTPKEGYREDAYRSADYLYGRSKALGELVNEKDVTLRTSIVGPDINQNGTGLFHWFMKQSGPVKGYTGAIWSGVTTIVLADAINAALTQEASGLYHITNGEKISKFALLEQFNKLRGDPITIIPSDMVNEDKSLVSTKPGLDFQVPSYEKMVQGIGIWVAGHKNLYLQYRAG